MLASVFINEIHSLNRILVVTYKIWILSQYKSLRFKKKKTWYKEKRDLLSDYEQP